MEQNPPPFETMVFVCTHQRPAGERGACANPGRDGQALLEKLRQGVQENGLAGKVRVCKSGCLDRCEEGPNILVVGPGGRAVWFNRVSADDVADIAARLSNAKSSGASS